MVRYGKGAAALMAALLLSTAAVAQEKRILKYNADYDPIPLAAMEALIADFEADVMRWNREHGRS